MKADCIKTFKWDCMNLYESHENYCWKLFAKLKFPRYNVAYIFIHLSQKQSTIHIEIMMHIKDAMCNIKVDLLTEMQYS